MQSIQSIGKYDGSTHRPAKVIQIDKIETDLLTVVKLVFVHASDNTVEPPQ
jgi:hypothetical protein